MTTPTAPWHEQLRDAIQLPDVRALDRTFLDMVRSLRPDIVTDIGSRDGEMALACRQILPNEAEVFAFEANPENYFEFVGGCSRAGVAFVPLAIGPTHGIVEIQVPRWASAQNTESLQFRGIGSTRHRVGESNAVTYAVPMQTLARFFCLPEHDNRTFAHWIDVEGCSHDVLQGFDDRLARQTTLMKIEVETQEYWSGQKLVGDCLDAADRLGFAPAAWFDHAEQFDVILVNRSLYDS